MTLCALNSDYSESDRLKALSHSHSLNERGTMLFFCHLIFFNTMRHGSRVPMLYALAKLPWLMASPM